MKFLFVSVLIFLFDSVCVCMSVCDMPISQVDFARYNERSRLGMMECLFKHTRVRRFEFIYIYIAKYSFHLSEIPNDGIF